MKFFELFEFELFHLCSEAFAKASSAAKNALKVFDQEQKSRETAFKRIKGELIKKTNKHKDTASKAKEKAKAKKIAEEKKALQEQAAEEGLVNCLLVLDLIV